MNKNNINSFLTFLKTSGIVWNEVYYFMPRQLPHNMFICFKDMWSDENLVEDEYMIEVRLIAWNMETNPILLKEKFDSINSLLVWNNKDFSWFKVHQVQWLEDTPIWIFEERIEFIRTYLFKKAI